MARAKIMSRSSFNPQLLGNVGALLRGESGPEE
jgi:hypothetical protein